ncbi:MAG: PIN domain-containing protein [Chitinophagaceae bacterium]
MTIIVDANIVFSAVLNPTRQISSLLLGIIRSDFILISPPFLKQELRKHRQRLVDITEGSVEVIEELMQVYYKRIMFYNEEIIPQEIWNHSDIFTKGVDIKDSVSVASSLFFHSPIWSGDTTLKKRLQSKGRDMLLNTQELLEII